MRDRIYFIRPVGMQGPVKIGCSVSPEQRLYELATWSPFPLEIVFSFPGGMALEGRLHCLFAEYHSHREWFHASQEIDDVIAAIRAGTFDFDTLPPSRRGGREGPRRFVREAA